MIEKINFYCYNNDSLKQHRDEKMNHKTAYLFLLSKIQKLEVLLGDIRERDDFISGRNKCSLVVICDDRIPHMADGEPLYLDEKGNLTRFLESAKVCTSEEWQKMGYPENQFAENLTDYDVECRIKELKEQAQVYTEMVMFDFA
tara:strand:+ start:52260 stop:52691 length:432 start_codon:yes stop_codon:yes gene_type:complete